MAKSAKAKKPATPATPVTPVTPPNTSKRAVARLKVREAKHGTTHPRDKQVWLADTNTWEHLVAKTVSKFKGVFND
jgi:hypothetical protein